MSECEHMPYNWNLVYQCRECGEIVPEEIAQPRDIELTSLTEKVERLLDGIKRARQIVYSLDCECDEAEGYTCTIHDDRKLFDALLESE